MVCSYCRKVALYKVQGRGYCRDHLKQAKEHNFRALDAQRRAKIYNTSRAGMNMVTGGGATHHRDRNALLSRSGRPADRKSSVDSILQKLDKLFVKRTNSEVAGT